MSSREIEELVSSLRQFIQRARSQNDPFEYCRLCDELRMAEAALVESQMDILPPTRPTPVRLGARLALI